VGTSEQRHYPTTVTINFSLNPGLVVAGPYPNIPESIRTVPPSNSNMNHDTGPFAVGGFTRHIIAQRYPNLPTWALVALVGLQRSEYLPRYTLSAEARSLLNIALLPMPGCGDICDDKVRRDLLDANVDSRSLFSTQRSYEDNKEHVDLCRLSADILIFWKK
jgi:hypothetical protein